MAVKQRKISATNMMERKPHGKKVAAKGNKGANGASVAALFITKAEEQAENDRKLDLSMKDQLAMLADFSHEDHLEFRLALEARRDLIQKEADAATLTLSKYRDANVVANSIYVTISLWLKMSKASETGWKANMEDSWANISKAATKALDAQAAAAEQVRLNNQIKAVQADPNKSEEVKQAEVVLLNEQIKASAEQGSPTARTSATGRKRGRPSKTEGMSLFDQVLPLVKDHPVHEIEQLAMQLMDLISERMKKPVAWTYEHLLALRTKRTVSATPSERKTNDNESKPGVSGAEVREPVEAKGNARTKKRSRNA